ncbi:hypothetical protein [Sandarakinorhabdus sp. DWP1-3-1]|uniref:hypothetical protein n=1 Tax=Sandarakinorhabdus sp. DWP1-3-1 TaxID=2804627 RepID=UPI003CFB9B72
MSGTQRRRSGPRRLGTVLAVPAAIAGVTLIGLVSALTGDGLRNFVSWVALAVPVVIVVRAWLRRG